MLSQEEAFHSRLERFTRDRLMPAIYAGHTPLKISAWQAPGEPVTFQDALKQKFEPVNIGWRFGRAWSTTWLKVSGELAEIPAGHTPEIVIDFGYNTSRSGFQAEAMAFQLSGEPIKSIAPKNSWLPWKDSKIEFLLEVAANPDVAGEYTFEPTSLGEWDSAGEDPIYRLKTLHLAMRNIEVWELAQDLWTLSGLVKVLPAGSTRRHQVMAGIEKVLNEIVPHDVAGGASSARAILKPLLDSPAAPSAHRIIATGHAHIDSAWLWPIRETIRKCARTFSNVLDLMDTYPDFVFSASSGQHYKWIQNHYPIVFEKIKAKVAVGQWKPVGGMWVECDGNMPGSEAMVRQFVTGQNFFQKNFGITCQEAWLPDSFGYSAGLPQIVRQSEIDYFLSQKMSWNQINRMPHHTFLWEGIDGTRVFTHFPPADTYISEISQEELSHAENNFSEKASATYSLVPFGWGDGGGGPTREMIAAAQRSASLEGSPMVKLGSAKEFFELASSEYPEPPVWRGEMYLELHRGVFTSQHRTKHGNRRNEALLREAELWATVAYLRCGLEYPALKLQELWEEILLLQFHDILPGSAIAWVHKEAERRHQLASQSLIEIIEKSLHALSNQTLGEKRNLRVNSQPFPSEKLTALAISDYVAEEVISPAKSEDLILDNGKLRVTFDKAGRIISMTDQSGRDSFAPGHPGNELRLHRDTPTLWDAWDIDKDYLTSHRVLDEVTQLSQGLDDAGNAYLETVRSISSQKGQNSTIRQRLSLAPGADWLDIALDIDWHESEKLLKLVFPLDIHAERIAAETQFGHLWRANNENTSWEKARYETCQHRYLFIPEQDWAVAFANDSTYGYSAFRTKSKVGKPLTEIGFSILRAPRFPDPEADQGQHSFKFRMKPNAKVLDAVHMAYQLNFPIRSIVGANPAEPLVSSSSDQVVIETIKLAEDGSGDLIVRLYEAIGGRAQTTLTLDGVASEIKTVNLLEHDFEQGETSTGSAIELSFRPFEVITVRFSKVKL